MHPGAELELFFVEAGEVVAGRELHRIVLLKISLQNHLARRLPASRPSGNLRE